MDLTEYNLSHQHISDFEDVTAGYQSFILNSDVISICRSYWPPNTPEFSLFYKRKQQCYDATPENSHGHKNRGSYMVLKKQDVTEFEWKYYHNHNSRMIRMNNDLINAAIKFLPNVSNSTVLDVGCNDGSLLFEALKHGFASGVGFDQEDHSACVSLLSGITNLNGKFVQNQYDMYNHKFSHTYVADMLICSAVLPHISDPIYFLDSLSKMTNKVLLLTGGISSESGKKIIYDGKPNKYGGKFPTGFTHSNKITKELLGYSLQECGFKQIFDVEWQSMWPERFWYENQGNSAIIAIK